MIPKAIVAAALLAAAPLVKEDHRERYAEDIAAVVDEVETAHALVATGVVESDFRRSIERCDCAENECDRDATGKATAVGIYQLHWYHWGGHTPAQICADNRLSTRLAATALLKLKARVGTMRDALRVFIGRVKKQDPRLVRRLAIFDKLVAAFDAEEPTSFVQGDRTFALSSVPARAEPPEGLPSLRTNVRSLPRERPPTRRDCRVPPSAFVRAHWTRRPRDNIAA